MTQPQPTDPGTTTQPPAPAAPPVAQPGAPQFVMPTQQATGHSGAPAASPAMMPQFIVLPQQPAPAAQPQQPAAQPGQAQPATGTSQHPEGFPPNTPWRDMTGPEQVAYWQHQARKHEQRASAMSDYEQLKVKADEYERLVTESQTQQERAVAEARRQGYAEAVNTHGSQMVEQWLRVTIADRLPEESVNALLDGLDRARFFDAQGGVDTAKVATFVNSIAPAAAAAPVVPVAQAPAAGAPGVVGQPAGQPQQTQPTPVPPRTPDFGQGQPGTTRPGGLAAGAEIAKQRFAPK